MSLIKKLQVIFPIIFVVSISDQLSKLWILSYFANDPYIKIPITSFFDLVLIYNKGISFGFLNHMGPQVFWLITGISGLIMGGVCLWVLTEKNFWNIVGLSSILGGALGNMVDRVRLEAVVDFLYFHLGPHYWPAFNVADSAIVIGVGFLLWQQFLGLPKKKD